MDESWMKKTMTFDRGGASVCAHSYGEATSYGDDGILLCFPSSLWSLLRRRPVPSASSIAILSPPWPPSFARPDLAPRKVALHHGRRLAKSVESEATSTHVFDPAPPVAAGYAGPRLRGKQSSWYRSYRCFPCFSLYQCVLCSRGRIGLGQSSPFGAIWGQCLLVRVTKRLLNLSNFSDCVGEQLGLLKVQVMHPASAALKVVGFAGNVELR